MDDLLIFAGLLLMLVGVVVVIKPLKFLRLRSRWRGGLVFGLGFSLAIVGASFSDGGTQAVGRHMLIDNFMPDYQFNEVHSIRIHATPETVFRAIKAVTPREIRMLGTLLWIRSLPARLQGGKRAKRDSTRPILKEVLGSGFVLLAEAEPHEFVLGVIGEFWKLRGRTSLPGLGSQEFVAFDRPGYAKAVMNFHVENLEEGWSKVTTETRILATSPDARKKFARYWFVIYPGSATIRRSWLKAVKRRAESR